MVQNVTHCSCRAATNPARSLAWALLGGVIGSVCCNAEPERTREYLRELGLVNIHSPLEPSWPHTGPVWLLGSSLSSFRSKQTSYSEPGRLPRPASLIRQEWSLIKGLFYPVDAGLSVAHFYGSAGSRTPYQFSSWVQWTPWESFGWPALAFRAAYTGLKNYYDLEMKSAGAGTQISWGYRRFTIWGGARLTFHKGIQRASGNARINTTSEPVELAFHTFSQTLGFHLQVIPNFLHISLEKLTHKDSENYSVKIGCLL